MNYLLTALIIGLGTGVARVLSGQLDSLLMFLLYEVLVVIVVAVLALIWAALAYVAGSRRTRLRDPR
jgi:hypothetical protein